MDKALTVFVHVWVGLFVAANLIGIIGQFWLHGFGGGISYVQEIYSPFNIINYIISVVVLSPALGAYLWRDKRRARASEKNASEN